MPYKESPRGLRSAVIDNTLLSRLVELQIAIYLPLVFRKILIPPEVRREAYRARSKGKRRLRKLVGEMAGFFVHCTEADELIKNFLMADLDSGEAAAIAQADYTRSVLLLDEKKGRMRARRMQIEVVPTGKLLCLLKEAGAIPAIKPYIDQLKRMKFHLDERSEQLILSEAGEES